MKEIDQYKGKRLLQMVTGAGFFDSRIGSGKIFNLYPTQICPYIVYGNDSQIRIEFMLKGSQC